MSVSITQGQSIDPDLNALFEGKEVFAQRLTDLKAAKDSAEESLEALKLGQGAKAALAQAETILAQAQKKRDDDSAALAVELNTLKTSVKTWADQVRADAQAAKDAADAALADAQAVSAKAQADGLAASSALSDAKAQADKVKSDAKAMADKIVSGAQAQADALVADATKQKTDAQALMDSATQQFNTVQTHLATLKAAASSIGG